MIAFDGAYEGDRYVPRSHHLVWSGMKWNGTEGGGSNGSQGTYTH